MKMTVYWPRLFVHSYGPKLSHLGLFQRMLNITLHYAAISRKVVEKMCTRQSRRVIWDMINTLFLTTPPTVAVENTFVAFL